MAFMDKVAWIRSYLIRFKVQYGSEYANSTPMPVGTVLELGDLIQDALSEGEELFLSVAVDGKSYPPDHVVGALDTDHVDLTFDAARGTVTDQRVYKSVDDGDFAAETPDIGATDTSYEDTGVSAGHSYAYYVVGVNGNGESLPSATVTVGYPEA